MRILIVEDDARVASFIRRGLTEEQYAVDVAPTLAAAQELVDCHEYDCLLLDRMLPDGDGVTLIATVRRANLPTPILCLTAKDAVSERVAGLDAGADDYLTKPFRFEELLARIRALTRRSGAVLAPLLRVADLECDVLHHRVTRGDVEIELTNREYALLEFFLRHVGEVVTRTMLSEHVWDCHFDSMTNVIDVHIARLRKKIDDGFPVKLLHTVRGRGYRCGDPTAHPHATRVAARLLA